MDNTTIKINIVEVASELATREVENTFKDISLVYIENEEDESISFTEEAQNMFDDYYDEFYNFLENIQIK